MTAPATPRIVKCPICGKPAAQAVRPFCSAACKSRDLHRWLSGGYVIPISDDEEETPDDER